MLNSSNEIEEGGEDDRRVSLEETNPKSSEDDELRLAMVTSMLSSSNEIEERREDDVSDKSDGRKEVES